MIGHVAQPLLLARRFTLALLLAAAALLACGCANDPVVELADWDLVAPDGAVHAIHLPAHVGDLLPHRECVYRLRTRAVIPESMRGKDLTFAIPLLHARNVLLVDGVAMTPLDPAMVRGYRGIDQAAYRIPAPLASAAPLDVAIDVTYATILGSRLDLAPRISATPEGDRAFLVVRDFNVWTSGAASVVLLLTAFYYALVYFRDRTRVAYGWFALQGLAGGVSYALLVQGVFQFMVGRLEGSMAWMAALGVYASVQFTHAHFHLGPPHRAWLVAFLLSLVVAVVSPPFSAHFWIVVLVAMPMALVNVNYQTMTMIRLWRRDGPQSQIVVILISWLLFAVLGGPDVFMWFGLGEMAGGMRTVPLGFMIIALMQSYVLSREHHEALVRAGALNVELRRQIATRADTLAAAFAHASSVHGGNVLSPGERLDDRYQVVRRVGEGGAGIVYEVRRTSDGARLALKLLRGAADATDMARFAREAQLISKLDHPNVVRIVDVNVSATGFFYLVVEFVEGLSLQQHRTRFGEQRWALTVLRQMAEGLAAIHAQGIVHRDLKPANVLITQDGTDPAVKIADFGIAATTRAAMNDVTITHTDTLDPSSDLTTTGAWMGTPRYMAPELADGAKKADRATDVFSFGLIAYELFTGKFPYEGSAALQRLKGHEYVAPRPVRSSCPGLDAAIADMVDRCVAESPMARPDARTIAEILREA